jgi:hypothetical protein
VRDDYRAAVIKQRLGASQTEILIPPIFPPDAIVDPGDGTLRESLLKNPLPIGFSAWNDLPPAGETAGIALEWAPAKGDGSAPDPSAYVQINDDLVRGPLDPATYFPKTLDIPVTNMAVDGKFYLRLKMAPYNGQAALYADPVPVTCDDTRPYGDIKPLAMEIPAAPITDDYLAANAGKVIGGIPEYDDFQPGDKVAFFWTDTPVEDDWSTATPVDEVTLDGTTWPFPVEYLEADLRTKADGEWYLMYGLVDKATNPSLVSFGSRLRMALGPWPTGMLDPKVPLADDGPSRVLT